MKKLKNNPKIEEYNSIPVEYCKNCLSLKILSVNSDDEDIDLAYCDECGSSNIETTDIETWNNLYKQRYNKPYLNI